MVVVCMIFPIVVVLCLFAVIPIVIVACFFPIVVVLCLFAVIPIVIVACFFPIVVVPIVVVVALTLPIVVVAFPVVVSCGIGIAHYPSTFWIAQFRAIGRSVAIGVQGRQFWPPKHVTCWAGCGEEIGYNLQAKRIERRTTAGRVASVATRRRAVGNLPYALAPCVGFFDDYAA